MAAAKKRFRNQKLGRGAELLFETWANAGPFVANKQVEDYGIDYVCRELQAIGNKGTTEEATGRTVSVQVRSTSARERPRVSLTREDVETALRQEGPYCIVGIDTGTGTVHFRFLDIEIASNWAEFLRSDRSSITLRLDSMVTGMERFVAELHRVSRPVFQAKLAYEKAVLAIRADIPGTDLELMSSQAGEWALVQLKSLGSVFLPSSSQERQALARKIFSLEPFDQAFQDALQKFSVQPSLHRVWELTDGEVYFTGEAERNTKLIVEHRGRRIAAEFIVRNTASEQGYISRSGLVIRVSHPQSRPGGKWVHEIGFEFQREGSLGLLSCEQLEFLHALSKGAVLHFGVGSSIPVDAFGLEKIGPAIAAISDVYAALALSLDDVVLADLGDKVFTTNVGFIEAMFARPVERFPLPEFVLGLEEDEAIEEKNWRRCKYCVPFAVALKSRNFALWLRGEGEGYVSRGVLCGFRLAPPTSVIGGEVDFELRDDGIASAYFCKGWPPVPLTIDPTTNGFFREEDLPIEGDYLFYGAR